MVYFSWLDYGSLDDSEPFSVSLTERKTALLLSAIDLLERANWDNSEYEIFPIEVKTFSEPDDNLGYDYYFYNTGTQLEANSIDPLEGNPSPSMKVTFIQQATRKGISGNFWFTFNNPRTVTKISFDYKLVESFVGSGLITVRGLYLMDRDENIIGQAQSASNALVNNTWANYELVGNFENVMFARMQFRRVGTNYLTSSDIKGFMDNLYIDGFEIDYDPIKQAIVDVTKALSTEVI